MGETHRSAESRGAGALLDEVLGPLADLPPEAWAFDQVAYATTHNAFALFPGYFTPSNQSFPMAGIGGAAWRIVKRIGELLAMASRHMWKRQPSSFTPGLHLLSRRRALLCVQTFVATHIQSL